MNDLIAFFTARLGEDAAVAEAASGAAEAVDWMPSGRTPDAAYSAFREHVARHDPARVLREVEAGRQLLSDYEEAKASEVVTAGVITQILLMQIINRVRVYSDHPDYRPEWKP